MPGSPEYIKAWKQANRDRMHAAYLRYREKYPERFPARKAPPTIEERRAKAKAWRDKNPGKISEYGRRSRARNHGRKSEATKAWRKANPEKVRANKRKWTAANPGSNNERAKRWVANNPEKAKASACKRSKEWAAKNPDKVSVYRSRSHAKRKSKEAVVGTFTLQEWNELLDRHEHRCVCCGVHESESIYRYPRAGFALIGKLTIDHVIPLSKGGGGSIDNIAPLCLPCNTKKHTKDTDYRIQVGPSK